MSLFRRVLGMRLSSERFDVRLGQLLCFAGCPALLVVLWADWRGLHSLRAKPSSECSRALPWRCCS